MRSILIFFLELEKQRLLESEKEREALTKQAAARASAKDVSIEERQRRDLLRRQYEDVASGGGHDGKK